MPKKKMLISVDYFGHSRVAVIKDGILDEISMENADLEQLKGNTYAASVVHVDQGLEAAFIDYGGTRHGFMRLSEIPPKYRVRQGGNKTRKSVVRKGVKLLAQMVREPIGHKAASFTGYISLPGRYMVIMPYSSGGGISRKIADPKERDRLKRLVKKFDLPEDFGMIIRTAGLSINIRELRKDYNDLLKKWKAILNDYEKSMGLGLVNADSDLVIRSVRDYLSSDVNEVLVDSEEAHKSVLAFFKRNMPKSVSMVKLYKGKEPLFSKYRLEEQIEALYSRTVPLPKGGNISIDATEALVAIDVNSGGGKRRSGQEELSFEINKAAAVEVSRQLRLRDLGGLIVIDFIDMKTIKNRATIKTLLQEAMKKDKARVEIGDISQFGMMELSRQLLRTPLHWRASSHCPFCMGKGWVKNMEFLSAEILRRLAGIVSRASTGANIKVEGAREVIEFLANEKREEIRQMESGHGVLIRLYSGEDISPGQEVFSVTESKGPRPTEKVSKPVKEPKEVKKEAARKPEAAKKSAPKRRRRPYRGKATALKKKEQTPPSEEQSEKSSKKPPIPGPSV